MKICNNINNNNSIINLYLRKNLLKFNLSNNSGKNSNSKRIKKIMQLKNSKHSLNKNEMFKDIKTPIYKIKKNILRAKELSLNKRIKISSVSTKGQNTKNDKSHNEMNYSSNEITFKNAKDMTDVKEIKEIIKGCIGIIIFYFFNII